MWHSWALVLVLCALAKSEEVPPTETTIQPATTRAPPRTLDRQAAELAWKSWLQSPESGNQNAPPRRITTKSLFITPLNCPKGQRLDRNACVQVVTVNKDEHERILLEQLNALFTSAPGGMEYDYGDEAGPLQVVIPIGVDPQAAPLQAPEPSLQAQQLQGNYIKKDEINPNFGVSLEAELELLTLQNSHNKANHSATSNVTISHPNNTLPVMDKPKRDTPPANNATSGSLNTTNDEGQKELVYGNVNIDPILYNTEFKNQNANDAPTNNVAETEKLKQAQNITNNNKQSSNNTTITSNILATNNLNQTKNVTNSKTETLKQGSQSAKLNPETEYSDLSEAIKIISRFADVTTDDNFSKDHSKHSQEESFLGTRTRQQNRRKNPTASNVDQNERVSQATLAESSSPKENIFLRYPWSGQHSPTPPPNYPFRHLQDYWPGRQHVGGVYNLDHENPTRHHHSYMRNHLRPPGYPAQYGEYAGPYRELRGAYPGQIQGYDHRTIPQETARRPDTDNQNLYSLLGLRHWFSNEETSNR